MMRLSRSLVLLAAMLLSAVPSPLDAGTPTLAQLGVDRTTNPWTVCLYDQGGQCQPIGSLPPTGGGFSPSLANSVARFGAACDGKTDDSPALAAAATALRNTGAEILIPVNCRLRLAGAAQVWLQGVHLRGPGTHEYASAPSYTYGKQGGTILIDTTAAPPFLVGSDWTISGLKFYWPRQTEAAAAANGGNPIVYPALLSCHATTGTSDPIVSWSFENNQVMNAYDIADFSCAGGKVGDVGHGHWEHNQEFALRYHIIVGWAAGETFLANNQASIVAAYAMLNGSSGTRYLRDFAQANAEWLRIVGAGSSTTATTHSVDGWRFVNNYVFYTRYGIHVVGGTLNLADFVNTGFDQVQTAFAVDTGGNVTATTVTGGTWLCHNLDQPNIAQSCLIVAGGAPSNRLTLVNVQMVCSSSCIQWFDSGSSQLMVLDSVIGTFGLAAGQGSPPNPVNYSGITYNAQKGFLTVSGSRILNNPADTDGQGIAILAANSATVMGTLLGSTAVPIGLGRLTNPLVAVGNSSVNTPATPGRGAISGTNYTAAGNTWDTQPGSLFAAAPGTPTVIGSAASPVTIAGRLRATGLPAWTAGRVKGTVCVDNAGGIYVKTTPGSCL